VRDVSRGAGRLAVLSIGRAELPLFVPLCDVRRDPARLNRFDSNQSSQCQLGLNEPLLLVLAWRRHVMATWIVKSETYDSERALEVVRDQRARGYTAWIEDEHGKAVDEESLGMNQAVPSKPSVRKRWQGIFVIVASAVAALGTLHVIGLWVD